VEVPDDESRKAVEMALRLVFHGGKCCGIKTIHGLEYNPTDNVPAVEKKKFMENDEYGQEVKSDLDFFTDAAPKETYLQRVDRMIAFCERHRPQGIIEIVLADTTYEPGGYYDQTRNWAPLLRRRKFRCVNKCKNSNSGNTVHVFHRNSGE
jgi:hypothetical protein